MGLLVAFSAPAVSPSILLEGVLLLVLQPLAPWRLLACVLVDSWDCPLAVMHVGSNLGIPCCHITPATGIGLRCLPLAGTRDWALLGVFINLGVALPWQHPPAV